VAALEAHRQTLKKRKNVYFVLDGDPELAAQELDRGMLIQKALAPRVCRANALGPLWQHVILAGRQRRYV